MGSIIIILIIIGQIVFWVFVNQRGKEKREEEDAMKYELPRKLEKEAALREEEKLRMQAQKQQTQKKKTSPSAAVPPGTPRMADVMPPAEKTKTARAAFRCSRGKNGKPTYETFVSMCDAEPEQGWEIASYGFNAPDGKPYFVQSRQRSYGAFLDGEDDFQPISYQKLSQKCGKDINADNWQQFVPERIRQRLNIQNTAEAPEPAGDYNCAPNQNRNITYFYVYCQQRFGAYAAYFRKSSDGWRAFCMSNTEPGAKHMPLSDTAFPSEKQLDELLGNGYDGFACYDRLLSETEVNCFFNSAEEKRSDDNNSWNDIYGSSKETALIIKNGNLEIQRNNLRYYNRLGSLIETLARKGLQ